MTAPDWYRCWRCLARDAFLSPWPRIYREMPRHTGWYSALVPGSALYCYPGCLPVPQEEFDATECVMLPRATAEADYAAAARAFDLSRMTMQLGFGL